MAPSDPQPTSDPRVRDIEVVPDFAANADGSVLYRSGRTRVVCAATVESGTPAWLGDRHGWLTADYSLLPYSTTPRAQRERERVSGRTREIQRLIGRSLRASLDLARCPGVTIRIDCDVVEADGGTRTASISGATIALGLAVRKALQDGRITEDPRVALLSAISVGIVKGENQLDLDYEADHAAEIDLNLVGTADRRLVEIQGSSESVPISLERWFELLELGHHGLTQVGAVVATHTPAIDP